MKLPSLAGTNFWFVSTEVSYYFYLGSSSFFSCCSFLSPLSAMPCSQITRLSRPMLCWAFELTVPNRKVVPKFRALAVWDGEGRENGERRAKKNVKKKRWQMWQIPLRDWFHGAGIKYSLSYCWHYFRYINTAQNLSSETPGKSIGIKKNKVPGKR